MLTLLAINLTGRAVAGPYNESIAEAPNKAGRHHNI